MPNIARVLKEEISRISRKEAKAAVAPIRKPSVRLRKDVADLKRRLALMEKVREQFGPGAAVFVDPVLWLAGSVCVDILRLDYWLQKRHSDYADNESMRDFIRPKYGEKAERFVEYWIKGEPRLGSAAVVARAGAM